MFVWLCVLDRQQNIEHVQNRVTILSDGINVYKTKSFHRSVQHIIVISMLQTPRASQL